MKVLEIKKELRKLIEQENDIHILEAIRTLLSKSSLDPILKEKFTNRALKSEKDIEEGNVMSRKEMEDKLDDKLDL
ncbi:hypothetical protein DCC35_02795 [Mangrovivirga cuniculi]|uniref:Uncharacterized protein n=2 Tax=Mangrovivirga cuniculi TaxID=2715131 RepID=A0A4D7K215_9BACT|nr:hypothetical protein DCC35_02795 [Mangrovivirga cuniculi]